MTFVPLRPSPLFSCHSLSLKKMRGVYVRPSVCPPLYLSTLHPPRFRTYSVVCVKIYCREQRLEREKGKVRMQDGKRINEEKEGKQGDRNAV